MSVPKKLFEPIKVGNLELANRIVMLGMGLGFGENFRPNDRLISFFAERAAGGSFDSMDAICLSPAIRLSMSRACRRSV